MRRTLANLLVLLGLMLAGCAGAYHGRTITRGELSLVYDPGVRVYVVESRPDVYYSSGFYFTFTSGTWMRSRAVRGPWEPCSEGHIPPGLRKHRGHDRGRHRGHD